MTLNIDGMHATSYNDKSGAHGTFASLQDLAQTASKQARLGREEVDVVSTSLPIPAAGTSQVDAQIRASVAAAGFHTTGASAQLESGSADQTDVLNPSGRGAVGAPSGDSSKATTFISADKHMPPNPGLLTSILGDYGSDSDENDQRAT